MQQKDSTTTIPGAQDVYQRPFVHTTYGVGFHCTRCHEEAVKCFCEGDLREGWMPSAGTIARKEDNDGTITKHTRNNSR